MQHSDTAAPLPVGARPEQILEAMAAFLSDALWDETTIEAIADYLIDAGYEIEEPSEERV